MKIVCLAKRRPLGRDLFQQAYGRFYHFARGLAERGHEVHLLLLNYQREEEFQEQREGINWQSINLAPDPTRYYRRARDLGAGIGAHWIIGFSDTWFGICAETVARRIGARSLIDAYDNYESYMPWCKPLHWRWRQALRRCDHVTAAGPSLLSQMCLERKDRAAPGSVLPMAAAPGFVPRSKPGARAQLLLQAATTTVIYTGSMFKNRGIKILLEACKLVGKQRSDVQFLFSGRQDQAYTLPPNCRHLGYVDDNALKDLYAAADLLVAINTLSAFGEHSYPVKLCEAMAMGLPVLATDTAASRYILREQPTALVPPENPTALAELILDRVRNPMNPPDCKAGWLSQVSQLAGIIETQGD